MSKNLPRELIAEKAKLVEAPKQRHEVDRSFELPKGLYGATVALYLGFLAVMAVGLSTPGLIIPMVIFAFTIVAGFMLPAVWSKMEPHNPVRQLSWSQLRFKGVSTFTGHVAARDVAAQVLVLPALVFFWGVTCVIIAGVVR